ncbi:hypothetical protein BC833DRAFT_607296 [Globomyces pollinis-pini]|nr:hypothetical protein BC833DRAFT_607296 [Globomyces pollinis-pini]
MDDLKTPRVNSTTIQNHIGNIITLVGTIISIQSPYAVLVTPDHGQTRILLADDSKCQLGVVQVLGKVEPDLSVVELDSVVYPNDFDTGNYDTMVSMATKLPLIFGW